MILIDNIPSEIQIPIHLQSNGEKRVVLYDSVGKDVFMTDRVSIDGLHYRVLVDGEIEQGTYRYQVEEDNKVLEAGFLRYTAQKQRDVYETTSTNVIYYK